MFKVKKGFTVIEIAIVVAIVALLAGVWYVSKNRAGADTMLGIGGNGTTATGGNTTPNMTGTVKGQITDKDGKAVASGDVNFTNVGTGECYPPGDILYVIGAVKSYYNGKIPPGKYCVAAMGQVNYTNGTNIGISPSVIITVSPGSKTTRDFKLK